VHIQKEMLKKQLHIMLEAKNVVFLSIYDFSHKMKNCNATTFDFNQFAQQ